MVRGEPNMVFIKLEKPLFLRCALIGLSDLASADTRLGDMMPASERGGVVSTGPPLPSDMFCELRKTLNRRSGEVWVCGGGYGRDGFVHASDRGSIAGCDTSFSGRWVSRIDCRRWNRP